MTNKLISKPPRRHPKSLEWKQAYIKIQHKPMDCCAECTMYVYCTYSVHYITPAIKSKAGEILRLFNGSNSILNC